MTGTGSIAAGGLDEGGAGALPAPVGRADERLRRDPSSDPSSGPSSGPAAPPPGGLARRLSDALHRRRGLLLAALLGPPLLWLGVIYLGSLLALLANAFFGLDEFTGQVVREFTLSNFVELAAPANVDVALRTVGMAIAVTLACTAIGFPVAYYMARHARGTTRALLFVAVMLPLWSSYLVRLYAWKLLLAKEGAISWIAAELNLGWLIEAALATPGIGGPSLSFSRIGTFVVFVYMWLPFMILPVQAAIERIPRSLLEASGDLGASPRETFRRVVLPLALPGIAAGSIFTFSLTLGDYIIPQVIGDSTLFIGQVVYRQQGVAGNIPFAAAFSLVPIAVIAVYLWLAKRLGAFDAL
jgi:putative spermidine/putrescine transport system permease protein